MAIDSKRTYHDQPAEDGMAFEIFKIMVKDALCSLKTGEDANSIDYQSLAVDAYDASSSFIEVSKEPAVEVK